MRQPLPLLPPVPFVEQMGILLMRWEEGESSVELDPQAHHLNSLSVTHGGVIMTLMDVALGRACRSPANPQAVVTIDLKTSVMRAAAGPLRCEGRLMHRTATMAFAEATLYDSQDRICAHATGTFRYVERLPDQARAERRNARVAGSAPQLPEA